MVAEKATVDFNRLYWLRHRRYAQWYRPYLQSATDNATGTIFNLPQTMLQEQPSICHRQCYRNNLQSATYNATGTIFNLPHTMLQEQSSICHRQCYRNNLQSATQAAIDTTFSLLHSASYTALSTTLLQAQSAICYCTAIISTICHLLLHCHYKHNLPSATALPL